jgi:hypothetical protein
MKYEREPFDQNCSDLVELIPIQNQKETSTYSEESVTSSDIPKILKKKKKQKYNIKVIEAKAKIHENSYIFIQDKNKIQKTIVEIMDYLNANHKLLSSFTDLFDFGLR